MWGSSMNMITTVIGFGMSATFIVFICVRIICRRLRGVESGPMFEIESRNDLEQPEHRTNGLEPVLVAAIPTMRFNHEAFNSAEDAQCSICLGEYQEKELLRIMPKCGHIFHLSCIDVWLRKQSTCPVCRLPVNEAPEKKNMRQTTFINSQNFIHHSSLWQLRASETSIATGSNQARLDTVTEL
ncbi:RING-H2 finger protein ATL5-like [Mangifera indica]|uniref:RING-H2 finger protein ATL5-like n=1 Tax=Mangifera indica TaxID=29780 RepID=UPI001CFA0220|nr:RING-H2 finger protein ATL5-like [Mangifera indica]